MFKRAYVEITNVCNLHCSFCPGTKREKRFMSVGEFEVIAGKLREVTDYLYLHVMGEPLLHPALGQIMGVAAGDAQKMVAFVPCSGTEGNAVKRFNYTGPKNCQAAMLFGGKSNMDCRFACIGLGNCADACKFGAMSVVDGVAKVDREKCVGCGACVDACPKKIVKLIPYDQHVMVACSSQDKGAAVNKICNAGCIGCMKCQRECPADAIVVTNNLAMINVSKCVQCGHCADICPRHIIKVQNKAQ